MDYWWKWIVFILIVVAIVLGFALLFLPIVYMDNQASICEFQATQKTIEEIRKRDNIESAAMNIKITECNQWLARAQYYNKTVFCLYIPNIVDNLQPIQ